ncbi:CRP-like cAMP-binding protein [Crossiella equi]|uniref:CRP-like cAMP-binding protein n=1 Tax=Crossiella equi TaxID=130796 RepID=A0ABS5AN45_9PSEU|nr:Crp/Fnr family transcriptional regulator [Crossiella equi]MBP2477662.1 CRP-like cAMP-binding protein [Crossiella equi]
MDPWQRSFTRAPRRRTNELWRARAPMNPNHIATIIDHCPIFSGVPSGKAWKFASALRRVHYPKSTTIVQEGRNGGYVYLIACGTVRLTTRDCGSERRLDLGLRLPGNMIGHTEAFENLPRSYAATALTEVTALVLTNAAFTRWIRKHRTVLTHLLRDAYHDEARLYRRIGHLSCLKLPARLALFILDTWKHHGHVDDGREVVDLNLSQEQIGDILGATRDTVNRSLARLVTQHLIAMEGRRIVLLDRDKLQRLVRGG